MDMFKEYGITKEEYLNNSFVDFTKEDIDRQLNEDGLTVDDFIK